MDDIALLVVVCCIMPFCEVVELPNVKLVEPPIVPTSGSTIGTTAAASSSTHGGAGTGVADGEALDWFHEINMIHISYMYYVS